MVAAQWPGPCHKSKPKSAYIHRKHLSKKSNITPIAILQLSLS